MSTKKLLKMKIKEKRNCERICSDNMPEASLRDSLYADHEITEDMVVGPVVLQRPSVRLTFQSPEKHHKQHPVETKPYETKCKLCQSGDVNHYSCAHCEKHSFSKMGMIAHLRDHMKPAVTCPICMKTFKLTKYLERHMITHLNERKFTCNICKRTYKRMSSLDVHKLTHQPKRFKCKYCLKTFTQKIHLQVHERYHTGEKPYECKLCFRTFTQQTSLNNHILRHTGAKPYPCTFCKKEFRQVSNLHQHTLKNHPNKNVEYSKERSSISLVWYCCENCQTVLTKSAEISKHIKLCQKRN